MSLMTLHGDMGMCVPGSKGWHFNPLSRSSIMGQVAAELRRLCPVADRIRPQVHSPQNLAGMLPSRHRQLVSCRQLHAFRPIPHTAIARMPAPDSSVHDQRSLACPPSHCARAACHHTGLPAALPACRVRLIHARHPACWRMRFATCRLLQGHVWREGYRSGALRCPLYPDVLPALQAWTQQGLKTYIFSSGSRLAQRDLFAHSTQGDVRAHLSGYFDTTSGPKVWPRLASRMRILDRGRSGMERVQARFGCTS